VHGARLEDDCVFPLLCPKCGGEIRIIAFINEAVAVREILSYRGQPASPPPMAPARVPLLWERADGGRGEFGVRQLISGALRFARLLVLTRSGFSAACGRYSTSVTPSRTALAGVRWAR
jgi:hypothetical protein